MPSMRVRRLLLALFPLSALGCNGDDSNGPSGLSGRWSYTASALTGDGLVCNLTGTTVDLIQGADGEFTGTAGGAGNMTCTAQGGGNVPPGTSTPFPFNGQILGRITGSQVQLSGVTSNWVHGGTRSGNAITGNVRVTEPAPDGNRTFDGTFSMTKQ